MRLTCIEALASRQALNRNASKASRACQLQRTLDSRERNLALCKLVPRKIESGDDLNALGLLT